MARRQSLVEIQAEQPKMTASYQVPHPPASRKIRSIVIPSGAMDLLLLASD
jgi:hypothetical protein